MNFYEPTLLSKINYNMFFKFIKESFILCQIFGILYFSYKLFNKYSNKEKKKYKPRMLPLPEIAEVE
jgi:hypothetical protein